MKTKHLLKIFLLILFLSNITTTVLALDPIDVDFYYTTTCGSCEKAIEDVIIPLENKHGTNITINYKEISQNLTYRDEMLSYRLTYPSIVLNQSIRVPTQNLTFDTVDSKIISLLENQTIEDDFNESIIYIPFIGKINTSALSLPILTITLGVLDSFNPCSFFILIFLLNLLIYVRSRKRMLLIGGIFIFFSGLFYLLFMFILFNTLLITSEYVTAVSLIAGTIALIIGFINIKDFFFFKQGPSLSIPESKKPSVFKRMRNLVKTTQLPTVILGTVVLAITVNFYELLCTLGFPLIYTNQLNQYNLSITEYYLYLIAYNIIYVIPLLIILGIFIFTLGRMKLSQFQGQSLKLLSGIMIFSFGILFIVDYQLLEDIRTPLALLTISVLLTLILTQIQKYRNKPDQSLNQKDE